MRICKIKGCKNTIPDDAPKQKKFCEFHGSKKQRDKKYKQITRHYGKGKTKDIILSKKGKCIGTKLSRGSKQMTADFKAYINQPEDAVKFKISVYKKQIRRLDEEIEKNNTLIEKEKHKKYSDQEEIWLLKDKNKKMVNIEKPELKKRIINLQIIKRYNKLERNVDVAGEDDVKDIPSEDLFDRTRVICEKVLDLKGRIEEDHSLEKELKPEIDAFSPILRKFKKELIRRDGKCGKPDYLMDKYAWAREWATLWEAIDCDGEDATGYYNPIEDRNIKINSVKETEMLPDRDTYQTTTTPPKPQKDVGKIVDDWIKDQKDTETPEQIMEREKKKKEEQRAKYEKRGRLEELYSKNKKKPMTMDYKKKR
jgi:hypothetical protein